MRILFIVPYPSGRAPSQRFRFEQYLDVLTARGHRYHMASLFDGATWVILYKPGQNGRKVLGILAGLWRRLLLFSVPGYDFVFTHREAAPIGQPVFEWIIAKVLGKRIIYDFDDAIWVKDPAGEQGIIGMLKRQQKVGSICRWAYKVSCGNKYLADFARKFNKNVVVNPTTLDTDLLHNQVRDQTQAGPPVIGWTGTHTTLRHLDLVWPVLERLEREGQEFVFHIISNEPPAYTGLRYSPWRKHTEVPDLLQFNLGLMPLVDDPWARGKCAFKALQYMALGMPALESPVGMNTEVVQDGANGFVCATDEEWYHAPRQMLDNQQERAQQGATARLTIVEHYSVASNTENFLHLFQ